MLLLTISTVLTLSILLTSTLAQDCGNVYPTLQAKNFCSRTRALIVGVDQTVVHPCGVGNMTEDKTANPAHYVMFKYTRSVNRIGLVVKSQGEYYTLMMYGPDRDDNNIESLHFLMINLPASLLSSDDDPGFIGRNYKNTSKDKAYYQLPFAPKAGLEGKNAPFQKYVAKAYVGPVRKEVEDGAETRYRYYLFHQHFDDKKQQLKMTTVRKWLNITLQKVIGDETIEKSIIHGLGPTAVQAKLRLSGPVAGFEFIVRNEVKEPLPNPLVVPHPVPAEGPQPTDVPAAGPPAGPAEGPAAGPAAGPAEGPAAGPAPTQSTAPAVAP